MKILFLAVLLFGAATAAPNIVGGDKIDISEVPYQIELQWGSGSSWVFECGGSIVGNTTVVTAGHCVEGVQRIRVLCGSSTRGQGEVHEATTIVQHPDYEETASGVPLNDIAVLQFDKPFNPALNCKAIPVGDKEPSAGEQARISGWGALREGGAAPQDLYAVDIPCVDRQECNDDYDGEVSEDMICYGVPQGGKDSCQGDSGGPVVSGGKLVGVVSWGYGCARKGYPGVYTNVAYFNDWVTKQVAILEHNYAQSLKK